MSSRRIVWIQDQTDNTEIWLPITPFVTMKQGMTASSQDLFGFGEIDTGYSTKLDTWSIENFFPEINNNYSFAVSYAEKDAFYYVKLFTKIMKEQHILCFQYYSENPYVVYVDEYCKIIGFSYGEKNGSKNIYYTLDFREYKGLKFDDKYSVSNIDYIVSSYGSGTYYVGEGDTLVTIAAKIYGDSTKWNYLMNKNSLKNPLDLKVGQGLKL